MAQVSIKEELHHSVGNESKIFSDGISRVEGRQILIYGAGNYGRIIYILLTRNGISSDDIIGFLDIAATDNTSLFNMPVRRPEDLNIPISQREKVEVIISVYISLEEQKKIAARLKELGYRSVRSGYEVAISFYNANNPMTRISRSDYWKVNMDSIVKGCEYWNDERSIETYVNHFGGYMHCDVERFIFETEHKQYFAPPPLTAKGYKRFIDCGAFDGDTVRDLIRVFGKSESLALFEPCEQNFSRLRAYVHENEENLAQQVLLFPCGVWDKTVQLRFNNEAGAASTMSEGGDVIIQCVPLDDALHGFNPTFIKMDVEGAESSALKGAKSMIQDLKPDLAISVYHALSHFWEIPQLVRQWVPDYRFYLRTYGAAGFETVMYASCADNSK